MLCVPGTAPISPMPPFLCSAGFFPSLEIFALLAVWSDLNYFILMDNIFSVFYKVLLNSCVWAWACFSSHSPWIQQRLNKCKLNKIARKETKCIQFCNNCENPEVQVLNILVCFMWKIEKWDWNWCRVHNSPETNAVV